MEILAFSLMWGLDARLATWRFLVLYGVAFLAYAFATRRIMEEPSRGSLPLILCCAVVFRLIALTLELRLSDDIYRYLWEGKVSAAGLSPFQLSPASPLLDHLHDAIRAQVNHPEIPGIYPPAAQALFKLISTLWYDPLACRVIFTAFDLLTIGCVVALLDRSGLPRQRVLLYAWNPLPILEFSASGHLDSAAISLMLLALALATVGRRWAPPVLLALSTLVKLLAIVLVPVFVTRLFAAQGLRRAMGFPGLFITVCVAAYLPYFAEGRALLEGLSQYGHRWSFNGSLFPLARAALGEEWARALVVGSFGLLAVGCAIRRLEPLRAGAVLTGAFFLLSPTAHPWYLCWTLPFLPLSGNPAWLYLSGAVALSYSVFTGENGWSELTWVPWIEYGPFYLLLAWAAWKPAHRGWGQGCG